MSKTFSKAQLNRRGTPRLIRDVEALDKGYDAENLGRDALINILIKEEEGDPVELGNHGSQGKVAAKALRRSTRPSVAPDHAPAKRPHNRKRRSSPNTPPLGKPLRKRKEQAEPLKFPPVDTTPRSKAKATTSQIATQTSKPIGKKGEVTEPNRPRASTRDASSPAAPNSPGQREDHEVAGGLSVIMEEETSSIDDREIEGPAATVDPQPSTMLHPVPRPRARGEQKLTSVPHSAIEALHIQLAKQNTVIAELQSEIKHLNSKIPVASVPEKQASPSKVPGNSTLQYSKSVSDAQSQLQENVESLSTRIKTLEDARLQDRINELEAKMDAALGELKEQRNDLNLLDKAAEVLYAQNKQLESRPLAGRVIAYGTPSLPEHLKRKHDDNEGNASGERPTKIFITPGLAPGTRQWVEEGPSGLKIHTQTGLEPLAAAYRRVLGV